VWVGHSCPTKPAYTDPIVPSRQKVALVFNAKAKFKSVGQECPTHMSTDHPIVNTRLSV